MRFPRATGPAITAKEFVQWLTPFQNQHRPRSTRLSSPHLSDTPWQKIKDDRSSTNHTAATEERQGPKDIGIAVSGGVDSMALVTLLSRYYRHLNTDSSNSSQETRLHALIVDHKLRDNSTEEAAFVAQQVQKMNVTPHVLTLSWSNNNISGNEGGNLSNVIQKPDRIHLETQARLERYKAIVQQCHALQIRDLFVGHHAGDQVETVLFRFSRASGIDGLAGIQNVAPLGVVNVAEALDIRVLRPLLNVSKGRLSATCEEAGTQWVEDPSNRSLDYQRNVIRHYQQDIDMLVDKDPHSCLYPLSTTALLSFRERMDRHRRFAWDQVKPWLQDIRFDSDNGVCHLKLQAPGTSLSGALANVDWLHESQNHVATRLLSYLVRWVSCKDHSPRLEDIQMLLKQLRRPTPISSGLPILANEAAVEDDCDSISTVYRRKRTRASKNHSSHGKMPHIPEVNHATQVHSFSRQPVNIAGVLFSPPRTTKGIADHWTLSRQPISHTERMAASIKITCDKRISCKGAMDLLWDYRFFIRISGEPVASDELFIRPLTASDVPELHKLFETQGHPEQIRVERFKEWMTEVPGNARFTIPIIYKKGQQRLMESIPNKRRQSLETIVSLPTLGIHLHPSNFTIESWFKSKAPVDDDYKI